MKVGVPAATVEAISYKAWECGRKTSNTITKKPNSVGSTPSSICPYQWMNLINFKVQAHFKSAGHKSWTWYLLFEYLARYFNSVLLVNCLFSHVTMKRITEKLMFF